MIVNKDHSSLSITGGESMGEFVFDLTGVEVRKGILHFVAESKMTGLILKGTGSGGADQNCGEVFVKLKKANAENPNDLVVREFVFLKLDSGVDRLKLLLKLMGRAGELAKRSVEPCCSGGEPVLMP
jgi:hypothetical protein